MFRIYRYFFLTTVALVCYSYAAASTEACDEFPSYTEAQILSPTKYILYKEVVVNNNTGEDLILKPGKNAAWKSIQSGSNLEIPAGATNSFIYSFNPISIPYRYTNCMLCYDKGLDSWPDKAYGILSFPNLLLTFQGKKGNSCTIKANSSASYYYKVYATYSPPHFTHDDPTFHMVIDDDKPEQTVSLKYTGRALPVNMQQYILSSIKSKQIDPAVLNENVTLSLSVCDDNPFNTIVVTNNTSAPITHFDSVDDVSFISNPSNFFGNSKLSLAPLGGSYALSMKKTIPTIIPYGSLDTDGEWGFSFMDNNNNKHEIKINFNKAAIPPVAFVHFNSQVIPFVDIYYRLDVGSHALDSGYPSEIKRGFQGLLNALNGNKVTAVVGYDDKERFYLNNNTYLEYDKSTNHIGSPQSLPPQFFSLLGVNKIIAGVNSGSYIYYFLNNNKYISSNINDTEYSKPELDDNIWHGLSNLIKGTELISAIYDNSTASYYFFLSNGKYLVFRNGKLISDSSIDVPSWGKMGQPYFSDPKQYTVKLYGNSKHIYVLIFQSPISRLNGKRHVKSLSKDSTLNDSSYLESEYIFYKDGTYSKLLKSPDLNYIVDSGYPKQITNLFPGLPDEYAKKIIGIINDDSNTGWLYVFLNNGEYFKAYPGVAFDPATVRNISPDWGLSQSTANNLGAVIDISSFTTNSINAHFQPMAMFMSNNYSHFDVVNILSHDVTKPPFYNENNEIDNTFGLPETDSLKITSGVSVYRNFPLIIFYISDLSKIAVSTYWDYKSLKRSSFSWNNYGLGYYGTFKPKDKLDCTDQTAKNKFLCAATFSQGVLDRAKQLSIDINNS